MWTVTKCTFLGHLFKHSYSSLHHKGYPIFIWKFYGKNLDKTAMILQKVLLYEKSFGNDFFILYLDSPTERFKIGATFFSQSTINESDL